MTSKILVALLLFFFVIGCGSDFTVTDKPEINWILGGENGVTSYTFPYTKPGQKSKVSVTIQNTGKKYLEIKNITLKENSNKYVSLEWQDGFAPNFPIYIKPLENVENPGELPEGAKSYQTYTVTVTFAPGNTPDDSPAAIVIESNDEESPEVTLTFNFQAPKPQIQVYPPQKQFISSTYECQDFYISNKGGDDLILEGVNLEYPSNRFEIKDWPNKGETIPPGGTPKTFKVCYDPIDSEEEHNFVNVYSNDPDNNPYRVAISCSPQGTVFEVSYEDQDKGYVDFTDVMSGTASKKVIIRTLTSQECEAMGKKCGGPLKIMNIEMSPDNAYDVYSWVLQKPAKDENSEPEVICSNENKDEVLASKKYIAVVQSGMSVELVITYNADIYQQGMNAVLTITHSVSSMEPIKIQIFGGTPKSIFDLMPQNSQLHFYTTAAKEKVIEAVIYNNGNGDLVVKNVGCIGKFTDDPSDDFSIADPSLENGFTVPPFSLKRVPVKFFYQSLLPNPEGRLVITYVDSIAGDLQMIVNLYGYVDLGIELPKAVQKDYGEVKLGDTVMLDGTQSTGANGASVGGYMWYLYDKPQGSKAQLNILETEGKVPFTPDVAGTYKIGLIIYDKSTPLPYFSDPSIATIVVTE